MPRPSRRSRQALFPETVRRIDDAVGHRVYRATVPAAANTTLFAVSTAAQTGSFWVAVIGAVALTGASGRRAAVRGALTLAASAVVANLGAKKAVGAPRPTLRALRHRYLHHTPTSPSLPSGHTATAAALATGVWVVSPRRGIPLTVLAALVGYSRLHDGAHWFSDVLTGSFLGIAVGLAGRALLPPAPSTRTPDDDNRTQSHPPQREGQPA